MKTSLKSLACVVLAIVTVVCSVVGAGFAASAAESDSENQDATESTVQTEETQPTTAKPAPSVGTVKNLKRTESGTNQLSFSWSKVSGAAGYVIYYRNNDKTTTYTRLSYIKKNSCTLKKLASATCYSVKVAAYVEQDGVKYEGTSASYKTCTLPSSVKISLSESGSAIKIKWSQSSARATGYKIYRMSSSTNGKYVLYKTIKGYKNTSFKDTGVTKGKAYYYRVKAYRQFKTTTYYSSAATIKCVAGLNAPSPTLKTQLSRVSLTWKKTMTTPSGYDIYYSTSKDGTYKKLGTTTKTFYNTKKLTAGKTYYFRVRAFKYVGSNKTKCLGTYNTKSIKVSSGAYGKSIGNTYVEISINQQHMWYYKNGKLIVETDVVTGNYGTNDTPKGAFKIIYKKSPATLMLGSKVTYWMPFTSDGCGIHDASWRKSSEYGGTTYKGNGSHGCVNTPYNAVKKIYNNISAGTYVVVY